MDKIIKLKEPTIDDLKKSFQLRSDKIKQKLDEISKSELSCFQNHIVPKGTPLSLVIKLLDWGNNRIIKQGGFRVIPLEKGLINLKQWNRITDPKFTFEDSSFLSKPKGQSVVVIHIGE